MDHPVYDKRHDPSTINPSGADGSESGHTTLEDIHQKLSTINQDLQSLTLNLPDVVFTLNEAGIFVTVNQAAKAYGYTVDELVGTAFIDRIHPDDKHRITTAFLEGVMRGKDNVRTQQFRVLTKTGDVIWLESNSMVRFTPEGEFIVMESVCRDINDNIQVQNALLRAQEELEEQVRVRTAELTRTNEAFQKEILERRNKEQQLMERETDLEMEKANLQETNTALKVLLKQRDQDKLGFEEQVMYNVKELILPYLDKLKATKTNARQEAYLSILETNLSDLTSPFSRRVSLDFYGLTTSELKVANFIRQGKKTLEIASLLGLSKRTIDAYRLSIRRKLRIKNKKANLRTLLMSMQ